MSIDIKEIVVNRIASIYQSIFNSNYNGENINNSESIVDSIKNLKNNNEELKNSDIHTILCSALDELGYCEKDNYKDLNTLVVGKTNWTKYAAYFLDNKHKNKDNDLYNMYDEKEENGKQGAAWCAIFVDYLFCNSLGFEKARNLLNRHEDRHHGASVDCSYRYLTDNTNHHQYYSDQNPPHIGDQCFFPSKNGEFSHTGIVVGVDKENNYVYTIEGNTLPKNIMSSKDVEREGRIVCIKRYNYIDKKIGYAKPKYNKELSDESEKLITDKVSELYEKTQIKLNRELMEYLFDLDKKSQEELNDEIIKYIDNLDNYSKKQLKVYLNNYIDNIDDSNTKSQLKKFLKGDIDVSDVDVEFNLTIIKHINDLDTFSNDLSVDDSPISKNLKQSVNRFKNSLKNRIIVKLEDNKNKWRRTYGKLFK